MLWRKEGVISMFGLGMDIKDPKERMRHDYEMSAILDENTRIKMSEARGVDKSMALVQLLFRDG